MEGEETCNSELVSFKFILWEMLTYWFICAQIDWFIEDTFKLEKEILHWFSSEKTSLLHCTKLQVCQLELRNQVELVITLVKC